MKDTSFIMSAFTVLVHFNDLKQRKDLFQKLLRTYHAQVENNDSFKGIFEYFKKNWLNKSPTNFTFYNFNNLLNGDNLCIDSILINKSLSKHFMATRSQ